MDEYLTYILVIPLIVAFLYMIVSMFKKQSEVDQFFANLDTSDRDSIIQKLDYLEQKRQVDLSRLKQRIQEMRQRHIEHFTHEIEEAFVRIYFDYFRDNWIPFRKANWGLKLIFFLGLLIGFYAMGYIIYTNLHQELNKWVFIIPFLIFPLSLLLSLMYIMLISIFFTFFRFLAPRKGAVVRSCILFNQTIRAVGSSGKSSSSSFDGTIFDAINSLDY